MFKLRIIIADPDSKYLNKLVDYLSSVFSSRYRVSAFSKAPVLQDYLCSSSEKINILLAHPDFLKFSEGLYKNVELILQLSDGSIESCNDRYPLVSKYIPGEKMVSELVRLYSEKNSHAAKLITGSKRTQVVPVYSAAGGTGKSTVTLGLAAKLGRMGKTTMVLSFESINSIFPEKPENSRDTFAQLVFTALDNPSVLPVKFEACKSVDTSNSFDFIEPSECFYEISEFPGKEAGLLLSGLRQMGRYDVILVDLESKPDGLALEILRCADKIVLVMVDDVGCIIKTDRFLKQLSGEDSFGQTGFMDKIVPVLNKCTDQADKFLEKYALGKYEISRPLMVSAFPQLWCYDNGILRFDMRQQFSNSLGAIAELLIKTTGFEKELT